MTSFRYLPLFINRAVSRAVKSTAEIIRTASLTAVTEKKSGNDTASHTEQTVKNGLFASFSVIFSPFPTLLYKNSTTNPSDRQGKFFFTRYFSCCAGNNSVSRNLKSPANQIFNKSSWCFKPLLSRRDLTGPGSAR
ncbi:MAG: hypothetical protein BHW37_01480 [Firmicutes bacterium CAG:272_52_7]|nr:MAG: hypothetical protein BHW37_01480 [Firmicutes bacterium CAG:272_52_7]